MIRTTVTFEERLFKEARKYAIDRGVPFTDIVNQAVQWYLVHPQKKEQRRRDTNAGKALQRLTRIGVDTSTISLDNQ